MKLKTPSSRRELGLRAPEALSPKELEPKFSVDTFFTPAEWDEVRQRVFRTPRDYGVLQDRVYLSLVSNKPEDQFQPNEQEDLFNVGNNWVKQVIEGEREVNVRNWKQALHCSAIVGLAFPEKRKGLSVAPQIKKFVHEVPGMLFFIDRLHKTGVGFRILLHDVRNYLILFPEDRDWVMERLAKDKTLEKARAALTELAKSRDWTEYSHLGAELRLLSPENNTISDLPNVIDQMKRSKPSHEGMLYTLLPDLLEIKMLTADRAELDADGRLRIHGGVAKTLTPNPLPTRLVA